MTTVAWDGKILAADRLANDQGMPIEARKIFTLQDGRMLAFAGSFNDAYDVVSWLNGEGAEPGNLEEFSAILIDFDGLPYLLQGGMQMLPLDPSKPHAIGCGRDFAIATMHLGGTAVDAVMVASKFDVNTGLGVDAFRIELLDEVEDEPEEFTWMQVALERALKLCGRGVAHKTYKQQSAQFIARKLEV
jgi:ATP-dependent protease HslVU (ClpYQ) peptidase subunit